MNLKNSDLEGSQLGNVNLRVATLKGANLQNCILRGAVLAGADLEVRSEFVSVVVPHNFGCLPEEGGGWGEDSLIDPGVMSWEVPSVYSPYPLPLVLFFALASFPVALASQLTDHIVSVVLCRLTVSPLYFTS